MPAPALDSVSDDKSLKETVLYLEIVLPIALFILFVVLWKFLKQLQRKNMMRQALLAVMKRLREGEDEVVEVFTSLSDDSSPQSHAWRLKETCDLHESADVVFVCTDIMNSTLMAEANAGAYQRLQEIHDDHMMNLCRAHGGYLCGTQGDAFEIVFPSLVSAVMFALDVQETLLQHPWSDDVLTLPSCAPVLDEWMVEVVAGEVLKSWANSKSHLKARGGVSPFIHTTYTFAHLNSHVLSTAACLKHVVTSP